MIRSASGRLTNFRVPFVRQALEGNVAPALYGRTSTRGRHDKCWYHSPNDGYTRTSPFDLTDLFGGTLDQYVWQHINRWQDKTAAICVVTGRQYTFAKLRDCSAALAVRLQNVLHFQPRDVIAVCLPNLPEYPIAAFGSLEAGLTVSPVNPAYNAQEIGRQLVSSNSKSVIGTVGNYKVLKEACDIAKKDIPIICIKTKKSDILPQGAIDFFEFMDPKGVNFSDLKKTGIKKDNLAVLPFSSGTTGLPKGVILCHENLTANSEMILSHSPYEPFVHETTSSHQEVIPSVLPFFHIYGLTACMISMLRRGCKLVTMPKFNPDDLFKTLEEYKGSIVNLVPPIILFLTNSEKISGKQVPNMRVVISGAAPIGLMDAEKFLAKFPQVQFSQGYGLTETSPVCLISPSGTKNYGSVGFVVSRAEARVVDVQSQTAVGLGPNEKGELCFKGPHVMPAYLNNEAATKNSFFPDKWFRTGDIGYYDDDGYFYVTDRMKELIKVKGFQVPPAELEELLRDHPKILDAAVIGIKDEKCGELPRAFVVPRKGAQVTEEEIKQFVAEKVIEYKRLEGGVTFLDEIPKTASGKILRKDLKAKYT